MNASTPVAELMLNFAASGLSAPVKMAKLGAEGPSGSLAVTVVTAVEFSATNRFAYQPPPSDVIAGASLLVGLQIDVVTSLSPPLRLPSAKAKRPSARSAMSCVSTG